ncbi:unnamed protein product [Leptidea sinapis]|uniref:Calcium signal-modulating cyclophilin ligand n=1 Tax=Leptidea sinapis TaxID=189913 RepID=A0A5E4Q4N9_9NEOP|nr:unnamed protein product [Leptidea sinapis]
MADAALARREARRRKILENSHNRLQQISGKPSDDACLESPTNSDIPIYRDLVPSESNSKQSISNGTNTTYSGCFLSEPEDYTGDQQEISELTCLLTSTAEPSHKKQFLEKAITNKYDIVLISMFTQLLYGLSLVSFENIYFFIPILVYVSTKMYIYPVQKQSNIANVLMLLRGVSSGIIRQALTVGQVTRDVIEDLCIFLFTTICIQSLFCFMQNSFVT